MLTELLKEVVTALEQRKIPYMISGSIAMTAYAIPRMTRDIDIVIELDVELLDLFTSIFDENFYIHKQVVKEEIQKRGMFNVIDHRSGYKIDFVIRKNTAYRKLEFERKIRSEILGFSVWLVAPEDLIISKLIWIQELQTEKQLGDIKSLLERTDIDFTYIKNWVKELSLKTFDVL